jgi:thiol-disulfide isomerase/thioredoxin
MKRFFKTVYRSATSILMVVAAFALFLSSGAMAQNAPLLKQGAAVLYLFEGQGCPHCAEEKVFLEALKEKYPGLTVKEFEVWYNKKNAAFFSQVLRAANIQRAGVPTTVVGRKLFIGYNEQSAKAIEDAVAECMEQGCADTLAFSGGSAQPAQEDQKVKVPLLGELDPAKVSLPLLTVVIGALDSFNPCAFFVLLFLLSMLIHAHSRTKMLFIGGIFVFFSAFIYFLFMAAWLNIFLVIGQLTAITVTAGVVALAVSLINIKDFFFFKKGISLMIPEKAKPKLFERMRNLLKSSSLTTTISGAVVLAVFANAYELLCTVGFPMVYTRALTLHKLTTLQYYLYLVFYNIVYVIPLAVIVLVITISLGARKLTEWQGRQLKLLSGLMMFFLGLILLVNPALLNSIAATGGLLLAVIVIAGGMIMVMKKLRPEITTE